MSITTAKNAARAALVTAAMTIAAGSVEAGTPYVFTAIDNSRHGLDVVDGQYEEAIARIRNESDVDLDFGESTNLCIAYTKSGNTEAALANCDRAVDIARATNGMYWLSHANVPYSVRRKDLDLVIALSNRGVVHATIGDDEMALEDLREADSLRPHLDAVSKNLAVLAEATAR